jgi:hypothetical protein
MCSASDTCFSLTFTLFRLTKLFVVPFINSTCTSPVNSNGISPPFPLVQTKESYGTPLVCKCISFVLCLIPGIISFIEFGAGPSGGALWGVDWIAWCWGRGFRSCIRHGFLSLSFCVVLSCVGTGLASGWSPVQGDLLIVEIIHNFRKYFWSGKGHKEQSVQLKEDD